MGWRSVNYSDLEEAIDDSVADGLPFKALEIKEPYNFKSDGEDLKIQHRTIGDDGAVFLKVAADCRVTLRVLQERNDYWEDNLITGYRSDRITLSKVSKFGEANVAQMEVILEENDRISIDPGSDHSGIAIFSLYIDGVNQAIGSPAKPRRDCFLSLVSVEYNDPDYDPDNPQDSVLPDLDPDELDPQEPAADPDGEGGFDRNPETDPTPDPEPKPENGGGGEPDEDEDLPDRSIIWFLAIGALVLTVVGVLTWPRQTKGE